MHASTRFPKKAACVKDHGSPDKHVSSCNWRKPGGVLERYMVEPYIADDEGRVALKPDYVDIVAAARARGRLTTTNANAETNPKRKRPSKMNSVQPRQPSNRNQD